jgi:hypothetical protein
LKEGEEPLSSTPQTAIEALLDKQAIAEVLYRYCRGCDRADAETLRACFHPDSQHRHGAFEGSSEQFCQLALKIVGPLKACKHMIGNILIELDGDVAFSEAHYSSFHRKVDAATGAEEDYFSGGRYLDRFERRHGQWKIARRVGLIDFERFEPPADRTLAALPASALSRQRPHDALYQGFLRAPPE